jgi:hypothetical protein
LQNSPGNQSKLYEDETMPHMAQNGKDQPAEGLRDARSASANPLCDRG